MSKGTERERKGASVLSVHLPRDEKDEVFLVSFRHPRTTASQPLGAAAPEMIALAIASVARRDATIVFDGLGGGDARADPRPVVDVLDRMLPGAEPRIVAPDEIYRFLWFFRDHEDPMTLAHASERRLTGFIFEHTAPPPYRSDGKAEGRAEALLAARTLLITMGNALGVRPPIPTPEGSPGWTPTRIAGLTDAMLGLMAGLLERWGSPLARLTFPADGPPELRLADS